MDHSYQQLAQRLDRIPNGFPATRSGVELRILAKLFLPEEARLASFLELEAEGMSLIADRSGLPEPEAKRLLIGMYKKGLVEMHREPEKGLLFRIIPFVVGFYEKQNAKIDKEFAELFEQYYQEAFHKVMTVNPSVHRVIPVEKTIPVGIDVMPHERASNYIEKARSWGVLKCICRVQQQLVGKGCEHTVENCLAFSAHPGAFDNREEIRSISKAEAIEILAVADREGLVHSTSNTRDEVSYICNCCTCSCGVLRGIVEYGSKYSVARSDFYTVADVELCKGCEACLDRCQFDALSLAEEGYCMVSREDCYGCGLCITACPEEAITLVLKSPAEREQTPATENDWRGVRAAAR